MIKNLINIIIVLNVLLSSGGFWINNHYCQKKFVKSSLFLDFGSCCGGSVSDPCTDDKMCCSNEEDEDNNCCNSQKNYHQLDQDQEVQTFEYKSFGHKPFQHVFIPVVPDYPSLDIHTLQYSITLHRPL